MNIFYDFLKIIKDIIKSLNFNINDKLFNFSEITVSIPKNFNYGDITTNVAMVLAKYINQEPIKLAKIISDILIKNKYVKKINIDGPGFINIYLNNIIWKNLLIDILIKKNNFGRINLGLNKKINIEYVSANPTGPLHIGHIRVAVFGDTLANLLNFVGYNITKEYYVNDTGMQIKKFASDIFDCYCLMINKKYKNNNQIFSNKYTELISLNLLKKYKNQLINKNKEESLSIIKKFTVNFMLNIISNDLEKINIKHDIFYYESSLYNKKYSKIKNAIQLLWNKKLLYYGKLPTPKYKFSNNLSDDDQNKKKLIFHSSKYGDDIDRVIQKSDGSYTYFASDIAYFIDKYNRNFYKMIYILGSDHNGYINRLKAIGYAISNNHSKIVVRFCQLVTFYKNNKIIKMSKRSSNFITLNELVKKIGSDSIRFMMLYRKNDAHFEFDFDKVIKQSKNNPIFYVQYSYARCNSIIKKCMNTFPNFNFNTDNLIKSDFSLLNSKEEINLIIKLSQWPQIIYLSVKEYAPHKIAFYLYDLANCLHVHWNQGKRLAPLRFIIYDNIKLTNARIALIHAVSYVLFAGLSLLGINAPKEMK